MKFILLMFFSIFKYKDIHFISKLQFLLIVCKILVSFEFFVPVRLQKQCRSFDEINTTDVLSMFNHDSFRKLIVEVISMFF